MKIVFPSPAIAISSQNLDATNLANLTDTKRSVVAQNGTGEIDVCLTTTRNVGLNLTGLNATNIYVTQNVYNGAVLSSQTFSLSYAPITDFWSYMYAPVMYKDEFYIELPYLAGQYTINVQIINANGICSIGELIVGDILYIGLTDIAAVSKIKDYSLITEDAFGNVSIGKRGYGKTLDCPLWIKREQYSAIFKKLSSLRATAVTFVADDFGREDAFIIYGLIADFELDYAVDDYCAATISIRGLY